MSDMNPLESDTKLVTYYSWFACPLLDLQAKFIQPRYSSWFTHSGVEWG